MKTAMTALALSGVLLSACTEEMTPTNNTPSTQQPVSTNPLAVVTPGQALPPSTPTPIETPSNDPTTPPPGGFPTMNPGIQQPGTQTPVDPAPEVPTPVTPHPQEPGHPPAGHAVSVTNISDSSGLRDYWDCDTAYGDTVALVFIGDGSGLLISDDYPEGVEHAWSESSQSIMVTLVDGNQVMLSAPQFEGGNYFYVDDVVINGSSSGAMGCSRIGL